MCQINPMSDEQIELLFPHLVRIKNDVLALCGHVLGIEYSYWHCDTENGLPKKLYIVAPVRGGRLTQYEYEKQYGPLPSYVEYVRKVV